MTHPAPKANTYSYRDYQIVYGVTQRDNNITVTYPYKTERFGDDNIGWRADVGRNLPATNPYTRREYEVGCGQYNLKYTDGTGKSSEIGNAVKTPPNISLAPPPEASNARTQALERLRSRMSSQSGRAQAAVPIAELREFYSTVRGINALGVNVFQDLIHLKHRLLRPAETVKRASDIWLTFNFGLKPMAADAARISEAIADYNNRSVFREQAYGKGDFESRDSSKIILTTFGNGSCTANMHTVTHEKWSYKYGSGWLLPALSTVDYGWADQLGLSSWRALPSVGWELVPYSWAVDYFTNVGTMLEDYFYAPPGQAVYTYANFRYEKEVTSTISEVKAKPGFKVLHFDATPSRVKATYFGREALSALPHVGFRFKTRDEIGYNGVTKILNLASVLAGRTLR
nr:MAG: maturation protein [Hangzhou atkins-like virus 1]